MAMPSGVCDVRLMPKLFAMVATLVMIGPAFAAERPVVGPWPGWHSHWSGFWWLCPLMMLFMFAFFALIFFILRRKRGDGRPLWRWMGGQLENQQTYEGYGGAAQESAMDILNKRYARGEIEKDEYEDKQAAIGSAEN